MNVNANFMEENVIQINGGIAINVDASVKNNVCKKYYVWNPTTCNCDNGKYLASIMDDSTIICDEVMKTYEEIKTVPSSFIEKNVTCKSKYNFYILLAFLLITINIIDSC